MRDNAWLQSQLDLIWDNFFADVPQDNDVRILFGRRAKRRLGSISLDPADRHTSLITLNGIFKRSDIPEFVVQATIVHELSHYAHGFNSPISQRFRQPHAGGVMRREFAERGLLQLYLDQKKWLKDNWTGILSEEFKPSVRRRSPAPKVPKPFWFLESLGKP